MAYLCKKKIFCVVGDFVTRTNHTFLNYLFNSDLRIHGFILKGTRESENVPDSTAEAVEAPADEASAALENGEAAPASTAAEEKKKKKVKSNFYFINL